MPRKQKEWSQGLFGATDDMDTFCFGALCPFAMVWTNAKRLGKIYGGLWALSAVCCPGLAVCYLRGETRELYDVEGDPISDAFAACCCFCCANCQIQEEIEEHEGLNYKDPPKKKKSSKAPARKPRANGAPRKKRANAPRKKQR